MEVADAHYRLAPWESAAVLGAVALSSADVRQAVAGVDGIRIPDDPGSNNPSVHNNAI